MAYSEDWMKTKTTQLLKQDICSLGQDFTLDTVEYKGELRTQHNALALKNKQYISNQGNEST